MDILSTEEKAHYFDMLIERALAAWRNNIGGWSISVNPFGTWTDIFDGNTLDEAIEYFDNHQKKLQEIVANSKVTRI